ncbi:response regulator transcription factor [Luteolibacter arcticus]|uniref:Response regulator transcription factor n=1 Tax=Luteolibacter arcticus TaxID=1581411 RepID=A0ABT3GE35_9BACT|nr:response regulator transcription factor [Luteolibacter arcticus]MCW1921885.1 response regulator transcription factor [Luteolibacter arcticus]
MSIRVGIVEDNRGVRETWAKLVAAEPGLECVGSFVNGEDALASFPGSPPDVVLMDIRLPGMTGIECTARLKALLPQTQILVVTVYTDNEYLFDALKAGASGYLLKCTNREELAHSIRDVAAGGAPMSGSIARRVIEAFHRPAPAHPTAGALSPREKEILGLLAQGLVAKDVARRIDLSYQTVRVHLRNIYEKLHVHSRDEAVAKYLQGGLTDGRRRE